MMDGVVSWLSMQAAEFFATKAPPQREEMALSGAYPCYRLYRAADGWLAVGALEPGFWSALCEAIGRPDLTGDAYAVAERAERVIAELDELFASRSRAEWMRLFSGRDVCVSPVNDLAEALDDVQVRHRRMVFQADLPDVGDWNQIGNPIRLAGAGGATFRRPPPGLGEHTDEVLREAGLAVDLAALRSSGVV